MIALIDENPSAMFIVVSLVIFITCTAVMLLLFVPKYKSYKEYDPKKSRETLRASLQSNTSSVGESGGGGMKFDILEVRKRATLKSQETFGSKDDNNRPIVASNYEIAKSEHENEVTADVEKTAAQDV